MSNVLCRIKPNICPNSNDKLLLTVQTSRTSVEDRACSEAISFYPNFLANLKPPCLLLPCIQHAQCADSCEQCVQRVPRVCGLLQRWSRISYTKMAPVSTHSPALSKTHGDKTKKAEIFVKEPCPLPCPSWLSLVLNDRRKRTQEGREVKPLKVIHRNRFLSFPQTWVQGTVLNSTKAAVGGVSRN